jgi:hypothetical protein
MHVLRKVALGAALMLASSGASAATMIATYSGIVSSGVDASGSFGFGANTALNGLSAQLSFEYSTEAGTVFTQPNYAQLIGAINRLTVTVSGISRSFDTFSYNAVAISDNVPPATGPVDQYDHIADFIGRRDIFEENLNTFAFAQGSGSLLDGFDFSKPQTFSVSNITFGSASFRFRSISDATRQTVDDFRLSFPVQTLSISQAGAVPEPSTWAMLIVGFGAVGAGMRLSRRRETVLAAA